MPDQDSCDLVVVGSGAAGLAAAVTAAWLGLDVVVIEKEPVLGGTSAWSGGWLWIPRNPLARAAGIDEDPARPRDYLRHELGNRYDARFVDMFLAQGPRMVSFFTAHTALSFIAGNTIPDFHGGSPGAALGGRSVCAAPFDGRKLGPRIKDLRPPLQEISPFGMGIAAGDDLRHFLGATFSLASFRHVAMRLVRHWRDVALNGRGMHLVNGNALVAALLKSADDLKVRIMTATPAHGLVREGAAVVGVSAAHDGRSVTIRARRGVVLAAGGFPHDTARKAELFAHAPTGTEHWSAAPAGNTGDGLRLGESAGGAVGRDLAASGAWAPVSLVPRPDGTTGHFPHLIERAKPGLIAVRRDGRRFTNEADSYHDMMTALFAATPKGEAPEAWLVCDHRFQRRYGLGHARPRPFALGRWLASGYLKRGTTVEQLAEACGIDPSGLVETLAVHNHHAAQGRDPLFHRGESAYNRVQGEPHHPLNPSVGPILDGPFYAVKIVAGSLGTFAGLATDEHARVLGPDHRPIAGLYAVGNDMASIMGGNYPSGGITLGPAMTFGFIAAHHASGTPLPQDPDRPSSTPEPGHAL
ncbi:FAD-dependent oxidoreductase [Phreatobacter stygius]|uniref:FAD-dependent oxidoreductase n=2 Tax=Phreatobacter stygius TaxID=1940610 RepID=A0A4D7BJW2_9HYPH|nr:FAD-dependent oxidoreductase [Phreatobacter stygius]